MDHLGERLSALVDGELGHAERDRALIHLAGCETCRFEAEMLRRLKRRLHRLDTPEPSMDFLGRLSALSGPPADPPPDPPGGGPGAFGGFGSLPPLGSSRPLGGGLPRTVDGTALAVAGPAPEPARPARERRLRRPRPLSVLRPRWERTRFAVAGASVVAVALGTAFVAGGDPGEGPVVEPELSDYAVEHAVTARQAPVPDFDAGTAVVTTALEDTPPATGSR
ncbi:zf-HC2 domain-containing protein [Streptomonospora nanhaiensis]|uniref:Anti-sigma factor RsiW n=1 Tax=Streptomonospora nanhaiensis TaxID=1323731 RepID=A0A853BTQ0_9ACTN|nr:zf-HC2 domain-containing protein [Streptomonospora nanhaiensis]MBV2362762.1 zf-HC2 domain-containing protein [Streptomonospora nanhaiensis]MBX9388743.1 zf-HC2 domain-containing protein [Streptomonospora nanhaiensis]NYI97887.1 anti-sigma factor RsiW [Streptomonospora nanhaiensis]